jgi:hypothetical protein
MGLSLTHWLASPLYALSEDRIENISSNNYIIACIPVAVGPWRGSHLKHSFQQLLHCCVSTLFRDGSGMVACFQSRCLALAVLLTPVLLLCVNMYSVVTDTEHTNDAVHFL